MQWLAVSVLNSNSLMTTVFSKYLLITCSLIACFIGPITQSAFSQNTKIPKQHLKDSTLKKAQDLSLMNITQKSSVVPSLNPTKTQQKTYSQEQMDKVLKKANYAYLFALCILIASFVVFLQLSIKKQKLKRRLQVQNKIIDMELKTLRLQMNPHFLFNALNSINGYIAEGSHNQARKNITQLAHLIRKILSQSNAKEITLWQELITSQEYLSIMQNVYPNLFDFQVQIDDNINIKKIHCPALIMQPILENALMHGVLPRKTKGNINIRVYKMSGTPVLSIKDNGIGRKNVHHNVPLNTLSSKNKALAILNQRLKNRNHHLGIRLKKCIQFIDHKNPQGHSAGTEVIIKLPQVKENTPKSMYKKKMANFS